MTQAVRCLAASLLMFAPVALVRAQEAVERTSAPVVPHVVRYSGTLSADSAAPASVRFAVYAAAAGGEPLWSEEQQVTPDASGKYTVLLGSATTLPDEIFARGEARWVGVTLAGQPESVRTPLAAGAYALKAEDAQTLGGHPAEDFVLAEKIGAKPAAATPISQINVSPGITGGGTGPTVTLGVDLNYLVPQGDMVWAQLGAANTFRTGQTIDGNLTVNGSLEGTAVTGLLSEANSIYAQLATANSFRGTQTLAPTAAATATTGYDSNRLAFSASAFNKSSGVAQNVTYLLQAEPLANDTTVPGASLNLLYALGANAPAETGFKIASNGIVTFASGQTFPGAVTALTAGYGITTSASGSVITVSVSPAFQLTLPTLAGNNSFSGDNIFSGLNTFSAPTTFTGANTYSGQQYFNGVVYENSNTVQQASIDSTYLAYITNSGTGGALAASGGSNAISASANSTSTNASGVYAVAGSGYGVYASGGNSGTYSRVGSSSAVYNSTYNTHAGVQADGGSSGYIGLYATADGGTAISGLNNSANSALISQNNGTGPAGYFVNNTTQYSVIAQNNGTGSAGYFTGASTSAPILTVQNRATTNPQNTQIAQFLGDNAGNVGCTVFGNGVFSCSNALDGYASSGSAINGQATSNSANGVFGGYSSNSGSFGRGSLGSIAGVIADGGADSEGVIATATSTAGDFVNDSGFATVYMRNDGGGAGLVIENDNSGDDDTTLSVSTSGGTDVAEFSGPDGNCTIQLSGNLTCSGDIQSYTAITVPGKHPTVATSAVQGAKSWVEDADTAELVDGRALVHLDPSLQAVADTSGKYQVFLTPGGDCAGLYVAHKKGDSFEVHELNGGHSSLSFDYRVLVARRGAGPRFPDVSKQVAVHHRAGAARPVAYTGSGDLEAR